MGRPYRPLRELEAHLRRGELDSALVLARDLARERGRPLDLDLAAGFLPLLAEQRPQAFDAWALRWLQRWCEAERARASVDDAAELAAALAEVPVDPERGMARLRAARRGRAAAAGDEAA